MLEGDGQGVTAMIISGGWTVVTVEQNNDDGDDRNDEGALSC